MSPRNRLSDHMWNCANLVWCHWLKYAAWMINCCIGIALVLIVGLSKKLSSVAAMLIKKRCSLTCIYRGPYIINQSGSVVTHESMTLCRKGKWVIRCEWLTKGVLEENSIDLITFIHKAGK